MNLPLYRLKHKDFDYLMSELFLDLEEYPDFKLFFQEHINDVMASIGDELYLPPQLQFWEGKPVLFFPDEDDANLYRNFLQQRMMNSPRNPN